MPHCRRTLLVTALASVAAFVGVDGSLDGIGSAHAAQAGAVTFNPAFLMDPDGRPIDVSRFEHSSPVSAGHYRVELYVNQLPMGHKDIEVREAGAAGQSSVYCFRDPQLDLIGLDRGALAAAAAQDGKAPVQASTAVDCIDLTTIAADIRVDFDFAGLRLDVSIPQLYLRRTARGYVPSEDWDQGITAGFIDYNASAFHSRQPGMAQTQAFVGLNGGVNVAAWRLRHSGAYSQDGAGGAARYMAISTYAQRDLVGLSSQLTLGQYYTRAGLFDSVPFTGVQLASDERMLPDSQRGFAPVIRGVAQTNAKVVVRQAGNVLYETSVAPGPFVIDDLYSTGYAGDLEVSVTEANGSTRTFTVPFAAVPQMLRPGVSRFSAVAGVYRDDRLAHTPAFFQGTFQRGLSNVWTGYTGMIASGQYQAALAGVALSTPIGALAADVTYSTASGLPGTASRQAGQSYRLTYSKRIERTQTNFMVAAYRFSASGYLGFAEYAQLASGSSLAVARYRNRFQVNLNQPLGERRGSFYLSGSAQDYWNTGKDQDYSYQAGYSNTFGRVNVNLSVGRSLAGSNGADTRYMLTLALPLGRSPQAPYLNSSLSYIGDGDIGTQAGLSGSAGGRNEFGYSVYGAHSRNAGGNSSNAGASAMYRAPMATLSGSLSTGRDYVQATIGASGSVMAHPGGINFSQAQGETRAVVEAKGAAGAALLNSSGAIVASNGYGVVSGLAPYRHNEIALDPTGVSQDVDLQLTAQSVAPHYGAIVMLKYPTRTGKPVLLRLLDQEGKPLPVGAEVFDPAGNSVALVGQAGYAFLRTPDEAGSVAVQWNDGAPRRCIGRFVLPAAAKTPANGFPRVDVRCLNPGRTSGQAHT